MHKIVKQHDLKLTPVFPIATYDIAKRLEEGANELDGIRSCGPISAFIRIKATETLSIILCYLQGGDSVHFIHFVHVNIEI